MYYNFYYIALISIKVFVNGYLKIAYLKKREGFYVTSKVLIAKNGLTKPIKRSNVRLERKIFVYAAW